MVGLDVNDKASDRGQLMDAVKGDRAALRRKALQHAFENYRRCLKLIATRNMLGPATSSSPPCSRTPRWHGEGGDEDVAGPIWRAGPVLRGLQKTRAGRG